MLLPVIGAGLGGLEAYRRSGGDLGATALGALGGAAVPAGLRMAGTALGGIGAGALAKTAAGKVMQAQAAKTGTSLLTQIPAAAGGLAAGVGTFFGAPALAGAVAAKAAPAAQAAAGGAAGLGVSATQPSGKFDASGAVPGGLPIGASPFGTLEVINPASPIGAARTAGLMEGDVQLANMKKLMPYLFQAAEARSKTEFQRQLTAAGVRQNIATAANMLERSQQAAQQMGINAASQAGSALTSQYQYQ